MTVNGIKYRLVPLVQSGYDLLVVIYIDVLSRFFHY